MVNINQWHVFWPSSGQKYLICQIFNVLSIIAVLLCWKPEIYFSCCFLLHSYRYRRFRSFHTLHHEHLCLSTRHNATRGSNRQHHDWYHHRYWGFPEATLQWAEQQTHTHLLLHPRRSRGWPRGFHNLQEVRTKTRWSTRSNLENTENVENVQMWTSERTR